MSSHLEDPAGEADRLLVERHRAGDETAFAELYARHYTRLLRFVRSRVRQPHVAEDIAQEAFTKALAALAGLRDPSRFYPWLTVIARHLVVRHHRTSAELTPFMDLDPTSTGDAPESRLLREAERDEVRAAMERVRGRHREILRMREHDGLSYDDIARRLGTPATTIPPLLFRARQALRREYLAVTEEQRKLWGVPLLFGPIRRQRARLAQYAAWFPDANALCASASCVVLGVGAVMAGMGASSTAEGSEAGSAVVLSTSLANSEAGSGGDPSARTITGTTRAQRGSGRVTPKSTVVGITEITSEPESHRRMRDRAREMPIYEEVGPVWFSADPDQMRRDIEATLAGNPEWMERE